MVEGSSEGVWERKERLELVFREGWLVEVDGTEEMVTELNRVKAVGGGRTDGQRKTGEGAADAVGAISPS